MLAPSRYRTFLSRGAPAARRPRERPAPGGPAFGDEPPADDEPCELPVDGEEADEDGCRPATAGEEIWERKGWNTIDSGWSGFF